MVFIMVSCNNENVDFIFRANTVFEIIYKIESNTDLIINFLCLSHSLALNLKLI